MSKVKDAGASAGTSNLNLSQAHLPDFLSSVSFSVMLSLALSSSFPFPKSVQSHKIKCRHEEDGDARGIKGPAFPDTNESEGLVISSENEFPKTRTGGWNVDEGFICVNLHFSGSKVPCPLSQPGKRGS